MRSFVGDFESTTTRENSRVWAWGLCDIDNIDKTWIGTNINKFMEWCRLQPDNVVVYFQNMKWDSQFIMSWLFDNGYTHVQTADERADNTFTTLITDKGLYYAVEVIFKKHGKKIKKVTFYDSYKLLPMSVEDIARAFHLPMQKGSIDYDRHNNLPPDSPLTPEEEEYLLGDLKIVAIALNYLFSQGLTKMTIGSCAMEEYKNIIGQKNFRRWFPILKESHDELKQAYKGGFSYLMPGYTGRTVGNGVTLDINSGYAWAMRYCPLPYGTPIYFKGEYEPDELYPLHIQILRCKFRLKPGKIPTIQIKHSQFFRGTEYLSSSGEDELTLCLTSVDLEIFRDHYEIFNPEYFCGWKFKSSTELFAKYIDKWYENKNSAKREKNYGLYVISKQFLVAPYGKFGTSNRMRVKIPYKAEDGTVQFHDSAPMEKDPVYVPMAAFITAYVRDKVIRSAQRITDDYNAGLSDIQYVYSDTDSLHLLSPNHELPESLEIDDYILGAWKYEAKWTKAKYLRQKCYIQIATEDVDVYDPEYKMKVTVAGMPEECHDQVTFRNFKLGATYTGKKSPVAVPGGVILENIDFSIKP